MRDLEARVRRTTTWIAGLVALVTALLLPSVYLLAGYERLHGVVETEARGLAENLSRVIASAPEMWDVQTYRLEVVLGSLVDEEGLRERRRLVDAQGVELLAIGPVGDIRPLLRRTAPLLDAGVPVGRLEISRSLMPLLVQTVGMALLGVLLGGGLFVALRVLPLRALRRSADRFQAVTSSSTDAVVLVDGEARITAFNPAAARMFGYPEAEALGLAFAALVSPEDHPALDGLWATRVHAGPRPPTELTGVRRDGSLFPVELSLSAWRQGEAVHASSIIRDVTERRRAAALLRQRDEQLRESLRLEAVGRLAAGIAHHLNNVLTIIGGRTALAVEQMEPGHPLRGELEAVARGTDRAARLVRQLLGFGRRQTRRLRLLDLDETVQGLEPALRRLVGPEIDVMVDPSRTGVLVRMDPGQIEEILAPLAANAHDAMPTGGKLLVEIREVEGPAGPTWPAALPPGRYATLTVTDSGRGMTPETRAHLFEPFFTTKEVGQGTGLGLAMVYGIVKQNDGEIVVESEPGQGATFRIFLPLASGAAGGPGHAGEAAGGSHP